MSNQTNASTKVITGKQTRISYANLFEPKGFDGSKPVYSACLIIPKDDKPRAIELKKWIRSRGLADFKVPDQIVFVDRFMETAALKISRKELRAQLREQLENTTQEQS